ncbi:M18 family aminopeptidase [Erysipelotrichaceae bacterium 51-3]|uniref:M18 family aminopeptidase n=1 Tax=Allobaculum sp. JKK-2023 TaxID=3108943 RepID=UPI002B05EDDF|nr:M18 family aminopeptidase [Allobaculum sp. JKK-2023]
MSYKQFAQELTQFIAECPSMFHSVASIEKLMAAKGYTHLKEKEAWNLEPGHGYYVIRNNSSILGFYIPENLTDYHFQMSAAHSDSPTYKIKAVPELTGPAQYLKLNVEAYGGMIDSTWLDRPLSIAGRVLVETEQGIESKLLYIDRDILTIPNVPIHFNRQVNDGYAFNRQVDLCPLMSAGEMAKGSFDAMVAKELGVDVDAIRGKDLFLVNRMPGVVWGYADEFVSSPKLDDLECAYTTLQGFLNAEHGGKIDVYCCFDNEEVGSNTKQGAMSTLLQDTLHRINDSLGKSDEDYYRAIAGSFLVSADNGHAVHPNHPEKTDAENAVELNKGPIIKEAANQKYTTDAFSRAIFSQICKMADIPVQCFANRSDIAGGSTLGNLSNTQVSVHAVDIGLAQLAMHSSFETGGAKDPYYLYEAMKKYFSTNILIDGADSVSFE